MLKEKPTIFKTHIEEYKTEWEYIKNQFINKARK